MSDKEHSYIPRLKEELREGKISRREFLRTATLLGVSAGAAYAFADKVAGGGVSLMREARAASMPQGGSIRIAMRVKDVANPHAYDWAEKSNICRQVCEYLTKTGQDNITRPYLLEGWEASDDLKTWTLKLRKGVKWHDGRPFTADDVVWNLNHVIDPATGSSMVGLLKGYLLEEYDTGKTDKDGKPIMSTRLWKSNAIEKVDEHTVRLHGKTGQLAVPENLFHYPMAILDPAEEGKFGVGSNGTGPFELVRHDVGRESVLKARKDYWGEGPYLDELRFIDLGDDPSAPISALASRQVEGLSGADATQLDVLKRIPHATMYDVTTAETGVVRGKVDQKPFDDPRVRMALRLATDQARTLELALRGLGTQGEHHHVSPIHPEYAKLPFFHRDVARAKKLLAEAGHPNGLDLEVACPKDPTWQPAAIQAMVEQWQEANIRVKINVMPGAQFWDVWDKVPFGYTLWYHRPLGVMVLGLAYRTGVPWNESNYSNPEFDRLLTQADGILDVDERRKVMAKLEKILQEDGPIVQPFWRNLFTFYDKRVQGFKMHPTNYIFGQELAVEA
jgi:peptide/nickel transport system substrate-binding protein